MKLTKLKLNNYTVFRNNEFEFCDGINVFIGENGTGKTHILKLLYSACQAGNRKISFSQKIVRTMLPDNYSIARLINKKAKKENVTVAVVGCESVSGKANAGNQLELGVTFGQKTNKWDAAVAGEAEWENKFSNAISVFLPAKEILSNSYNLVAVIDKNNLQFDDTYVDVINSSKAGIAGQIKAVGDRRLDELDIPIVEWGKVQPNDLRLLKIQRLIDAKVEYDKYMDEFYLKRGKAKMELNLAAEGIRKLALLWQLINNGYLESGSVLFWDEPEANINPKYISALAEILLELQRGGVQIFLATHDYLLAKYLEIKQDEENEVLYHSLNISEHGIENEAHQKFDELKHNSIIQSFDELLKKVYDMEF